MDAPEQPAVAAQASKQTTERIQALGEISKQIPQMLQHAGLAINALTKNPQPADEDTTDSAGTALDARRAIFKENIAGYYTLLRDITIALKDENKALVDAKLIPAKKVKKSIAAAGSVGITNGGLGNLDIGYLNSRTRDVGLAKEADLVRELRGILEKYVEGEKADKGDEGEEMDES